MKLIDVRASIVNADVLKSITPAMLRMADEMVGAAAKAAYALIVNKAKTQLDDKKAQQYLNSLSISRVEDGYEIKLSHKASWIEQGLQPGAMLPKLAQGPASKAYKTGGGRYVRIPMSQQSPNKRIGSVKQLEMGKLVGQVLKQAKIRKTITRDVDNRPYIGVVKNIKGVKVGPVSKRGVPVLEGLQVAQHAKGSKGATRSYTTFRTASTRQDPKNYWFRSKEIKGLKAFESAVEFLESRLNNIVKDIFN